MPLWRCPALGSATLTGYYPISHCLAAQYSLFPPAATNQSTTKYLMYSPSYVCTSAAESLTDPYPLQGCYAFPGLGGGGGRVCATTLFTSSIPAVTMYITYRHRSHPSLSPGAERTSRASIIKYNGNNGRLLQQLCFVAVESANPGFLVLPTQQRA